MLVVLTALLSFTAAADEARALEARDRAGAPAPRIMPPLPPGDPGPALPRVPLTLADARARLRALTPRVNECFATHFEGERVPRRYALTLFVHPDGRWSLGFGAGVRAPARNVEARGQSPLEVCIADWVSGELGPVLQPPGRVQRRVVVTLRPAAP